MNGPVMMKEFRYVDVVYEGVPMCLRVEIDFIKVAHYLASRVKRSKRELAKDCNGAVTCTYAANTVVRSTHKASKRMES